LGLPPVLQSGSLGRPAVRVGRATTNSAANFVFGKRRKRFKVRRRCSELIENCRKTQKK